MAGYGRCPAIGALVTRTIVLRLATTTPGDRLHGVLEDVASGFQAPFSSDHDLATILRRLAADGRSEAATGRDPSR